VVPGDAEPPEPKGAFSPGVRAMLLSAMAFSVMSALVKLVGARLSAMEIGLVRALVTLVLSAWAVRKAGLSPWGVDRKWLLVRGLLGFLGLHTYFYSLTHLPLADASVIQLTSPLLVAIAASIFLAEPLRRSDLVGIACGLLGVLLVARPTFLFGGEERPLPPFALAIAVAGAFVGAGASVVVRKLRATEHPLVVVLQFPLLTVPLTLPLAIPVWVWPTPVEWALLIGIGIATQYGQLKMTQALHLERAAKITAVSYVQILYAIALAVLFFGEMPTAWTIAGALAIAIGTAIVTRAREPAAPPAAG
jgi:drug/metabolite transporter (DMT)-like permease